jgi:hypothetical protein
MDGERRHTLSDSQIDRELDAAFGIDPSPEFLARVRTRIASDPGLAAESGFSRIRRLFFEPLAGVALVGIVLAVVAPQLLREDLPNPDAHSAARTAVDVRDVEAAKALEPPAQTPVGQTPVGADLQVGPPAGAGVQVGPRPLGRLSPLVESPRTLPLQLSPVLIAEDERHAFEFFVRAVSQGRVPEDVVKRSAESRIQAALTIEPLEIPPLPPLARGAQEGEGQWE